MNDESLMLMHWCPKPPAKRQGGRWCSKVQARAKNREREAERKRERYAANRDAERAKARARYWANAEEFRARKRVENLSLRQRVHARMADARKYERHREKILAAQKERDTARRLLEFLRRFADKTKRGTP